MDCCCRKDERYADLRRENPEYYSHLERKWFTVKITLALLICGSCLAGLLACEYYLPQFWDYAIWFGCVIAAIALFLSWGFFCCINCHINHQLVRYNRNQIRRIRVPETVEESRKLLHPVPRFPGDSPREEISLKDNESPRTWYDSAT